MPFIPEFHSGAERNAYLAGIQAYEEINGDAQCPYNNEALEHAWLQGYSDAEEATTHFTPEAS